MSDDVEELNPCPSCGYLVFPKKPGSHAICPICFWEDDLVQLRFVTQTGANSVSLIDAQENFVRLGACEARAVKFVRSRRPGDKKDDGWHRFDPLRDIAEDVAVAVKRNVNDVELYYWRKVRR